MTSSVSNKSRPGDSEYNPAHEKRKDYTVQELRDFSIFFLTLNVLFIDRECFYISRALIYKSTLPSRHELQFLSVAEAQTAPCQLLKNRHKMIFGTVCIAGITPSRH